MKSLLPYPSVSVVSAKIPCRAESIDNLSTLVQLIKSYDHHHLNRLDTMNHTLLLKTDRLLLRTHAADDLDALFELAQDPSVSEFIRGLPTTREEARHRLLRYIGHWHLFGYGMLAVVERCSGSIIGEVGLANFRRGLGADFDTTPEAAWLFARHAHGRGLATEALTSMLHWFDQAFPGQRCVCIIDVNNTASIKLAARLNFHRYGAVKYRGADVAKLERLGAEL